MVIIKHHAVELNWNQLIQIENPRTLVLGSFNPFDKNSNSHLHYYYGRQENHFWKSIARNIGKDENYFFDTANGYKRKLNVMKGRFCCLDVIDEIEFNSPKAEKLNNHIQQQVLSNFLDQTIWVSKTKTKENEIITLKRKYNQGIIDLLQQSKTIKKVIHTMGNNRIMRKSAYPKEVKLGADGFNDYVIRIVNICNQKGIDFIYQSFSPSNYAIKTKKVKIEDLDNWLKESLFL